MVKGNKIFDLFRTVLIFTSLDRYYSRLIRGKKHDSFIGKMAPNNYQYKKGTYRIARLNNNIKLSVDLHDYLGHYIYFGYKDQSQDALLKLVEENYSVLDIGTNIGNTALLFADKVKAAGRVIGFEPDPETYQLCMKNLELNSFENLKVHNIGFGDNNSSFFIESLIDSNISGNRINEKLTQGQKQVSVKRLDDVFFDFNLKKVDLVKIDVEGYEMKVLIGAKETIQKFKPTLFIEIDDNNLRDQKSSAQELLDFLEKNNYTSVEAVSNKPINSNYNFKDCHFDIISTSNC
ncbi:MAG: FkbM family methyltransferase [Bacteroidetes bacterium]|nr:FkbM family methyltransferase [Bacteroidota bacterium]HET6244014.1 FkbM family methyltransferase [Bacteroidia bacterium]